MTPDHVTARLLPLVVPGRAESEARYLKHTVPHLGVPVPALRSVAKDLRRAHPDEDWRTLVEALWDTGVHELRGMAMLLSVKTVRDLDLFERWLREGRSWAYVDAIATDLVAPIAPPERLDRWAVDPDFWVRRAAMLALLPALRKGGGDWARFTRYADAQLDETEFFLRKAIGWVLREVSKKRPALIVEFLLPRMRRASGVTLREALRYLPDADRERLLAARGPATPARGRRTATPPTAAGG